MCKTIMSIFETLFAMCQFDYLIKYAF